MSYTIEEIEGIGSIYGEKLRSIGVKTTEELLIRSRTPKGRQELEEASGISGAFILKWANRADLMRVNGIGTQYGDLLEAAGVDTVPELAQRKPENLARKLVEVNEEKKLVRQVPSESSVEKWVAEAKTLERALEY